MPQPRLPRIKKLWLLRGSLGGEVFVAFVCLLIERFWACLKNHATIPLLKEGLERAERVGRGGFRRWPRARGLRSRRSPSLPDHRPHGPGPQTNAARQGTSQPTRAVGRVNVGRVKYMLFD